MSSEQLQARRFQSETNSQQIRKGDFRIFRQPALMRSVRVRRSGAKCTPSQRNCEIEKREKPSRAGAKELENGEWNRTKKMHEVLRLIKTSSVSICQHSVYTGDLLLFHLFIAKYQFSSGA